MSGAHRQLDDTLTQLDEIKRVVSNSVDLDPQLRDQAEEIRTKLLDLQERFAGDQRKASRSQLAEVPIMSRVQTALRGTFDQTYGVTQTQRQQFQIAQREFKKASAKLKQILEQQYQPLTAALDEAGRAVDTGPIGAVPAGTSDNSPAIKRWVTFEFNGRQPKSVDSRAELPRRSIATVYSAFLAPTDQLPSASAPAILQR